MAPTWTMVLSFVFEFSLSKHAEMLTWGNTGHQECLHWTKRKRTTFAYSLIVRQRAGDSHRLMTPKTLLVSVQSYILGPEFRRAGDALCSLWVI